MLRIRGSRTIQLQPGSVVSGFKLTQQIPIPELNLIGLYFVHEQTNLKYYHYVSSEDTNNIFCIGFNTPNPNSKGLPHILEHTTLCGSHQFPVRDPFFYMLKRSLNTFMNAMTGPSYTIYPFSTVNEKDFSNLLSVYLDAVFKPLLRKRDFMQEGHRFEFEDKKGGEEATGSTPSDGLTIKGVVYNEMKGALENPSSFFYSKLCEHGLRGTSYEHVLGGCPSAIPDLSHEELVAYHRDHYHPTNAVVVTYGDLDFTAHLNTINQVLQGMTPKVRHGIPLLPETYTSEPVGCVVDDGPMDVMGDPERTTRVVVSWIVPSSYFAAERSEKEICKNYLQFEVLSMLLTNGPASPMYKALIDTHMGTDFTPSNGFESDFRNPLFSFGLQGVNLAQHDEKKIQSAVMEALRKACEEGFEHDLVDGVIHQLQLSKRHRSSSFGLNLSYTSVLSDLQSGFVFSFLETAANLESLRVQHKENKKCFSGLIESLFLQREPRLTLVLRSDREHVEKRKRQEMNRVEEKRKTLTPEEIQNIQTMAKELADAQNEKLDVSCLPTLKRSDIAAEIVREPRGEISHYGQSTSEIIVAPCNQLVYSNVLFPLDLKAFTDEETLLLPTYASLLCNLGAGELDYEALSTKMERLCSGFDACVHVAPYPDMQQLLCGLYVKFHALPERHAEAVHLLAQIFQKVRLNPEDAQVVSRVISLVSSAANSMIQSIPHNGHRYALSAAAARLSPACHISSKMEGLEQVVYQRSLLEDLTSEEAGKAETRAKAILTTLAQIHQKVCSQHAAETWHVCEEPNRTMVHDTSMNFLRIVVNEKAPLAKCGLPYDAAALQTPSFISIVTPGEVSYLAMALPCHTKYGEKESAVQQVALKVLSNEFLHREIREKGGAYGSGATTRPAGNLSFAIAMYSYRDPTPLKSFQTMCRGLQDYLCNGTNFEDRSVDEALLSMFGTMDAPRPPSSYGSTWYLSRMDDTIRQKNRSYLLETTKDDIVLCASKMAQTVANQKTVCVCLGSAEHLKADGATDEKMVHAEWSAKEY